MNSPLPDIRLAASAFLACCLFFVSTPSATAEVTLPSIISSHMVLQRSSHTRVWGKAGPSEKIQLSLGEIRGGTVADADGNWRIELNLSQAKEGPADMVIEGANKITVSDVLIGEVWLCSGQSNMAYKLSRSTGGAEEIARSANPRLRQFTVSYNPIAEPQERCKGTWLVADPTNAPEFSAVGYYFAKDLQKAMILRAAKMVANLIESEADALAEAMGDSAIADSTENEGTAKFTWGFSVAVKITPKGTEADIEATMPWAVKHKAVTSDRWQAANPAQPDLNLDGVPAVPPPRPAPPVPTGPLLLTGPRLQLARAQFEAI
ncbi:MAG: hypothetical protein ACOYM3_25730, partial [Terrimicrobiaceae bacterium]